MSMEKLSNGETLDPREVLRRIDGALHAKGVRGGRGPKQLHVAEGEQSIAVYFRGELMSPGGDQEPWLANIVGNIFEDPSAVGNMIVKPSGVETWILGADDVSMPIEFGPDEWGILLRTKIETWNEVQSARAA